MTKVVVVGAGAMGQHHARIYHELGILSAVCDTNIARAAEIAEKFGVSYTDNLEEVFSLGEVPDCASVVVPTPMHTDVTKFLLERGCHVMLEKPMAPTIEEAVFLDQLAEQKGLVLAVGYIETFNPAFAAVTDLHSDGFFGEIISVTMRRVGGVPRSADNVVMDLMTHDFSLLINLFGNSPTEVRVNTRTADNIVDSAHAILKFGEASAFCEANWISPIKVRQMVITGTKGYCEVDLIAQQVTCYGNPAPYNGPRVRYGQPQNITIVRYNIEPLKAELQSFVDTVEGNLTSPVVSGTLGAEILALTVRAAHPKG